VANLVNKQAFYNQYWLVAGLVALALAASTADRLDDVPVPRSARAAPAVQPTG